MIAGRAPVVVVVAAAVAVAVMLCLIAARMSVCIFCFPHFLVMCFRRCRA